MRLLRRLESFLLGTGIHSAQHQCVVVVAVAVAKHAALTAAKRRAGEVGGVSGDNTTPARLCDETLAEAHVGAWLFTTGLLVCSWFIV